MSISSDDVDRDDSHEKVLDSASSTCALNFRVCMEHMAITREQLLSSLVAAKANVTSLRVEEATGIGADTFVAIIVVATSDDDEIDQLNCFLEGIRTLPSGDGSQVSVNLMMDSSWSSYHH